MSTTTTPTPTTALKSRIKHPIRLYPEAMTAMQALGKVAHDPSVPLRTLMLVELRASQINGCSVCVDMHARELLQSGESDARIFAVSAWRENPNFSEPERAALALAESLTRIADRPEGVPDEVWAEAARHYDEKALAALVIAIANINVWNRLNVAIRQPVVPWKG